MSEREKKLAMLFGAALFLIANFFGYSWYAKKDLEMKGKIRDADSKMQVAKGYAAAADSKQDEMQWLSDHYPEPKLGPTVQTEIMQTADASAVANGLTVKRRAPLPFPEGGKFGRARVEFTVTGMEQNLYRWLDSVQQPDKFQGIVNLQLSPQSDDKTRINCKVEINQWFNPQNESTAAAGPSSEPQAAPPEAPPEEPADGSVPNGGSTPDTPPEKTDGQ